MAKISWNRHESCVICLEISFTDPNFADDMCQLAEVPNFIILALEVMATEAASLWLEVNWQKTLIRTLTGFGDRVFPSATIRDA